MRPSFAIGFAILLLAAAGSAPGAVLQVRQDGSGDFTALQDAADAAAAGDTILIGEGRYTDWSYQLSSFGLLPSHMQLRQPGITVVAEEGADARLGPASWSWEEHAYHPYGVLAPPEAAGVRIVGLTLENLPRAVAAHGGVALEACTIRGAGVGVQGHGPGPANLTRVLVEDCRENGVELRGMTGPVRVQDCEFRGEEGGMFLHRSPDAEIVDTRFCDGQSLAIHNGSYAVARGCSWERAGIGVKQATAELHGNRIGLDHHSGIFVSGGHLSGSGNVVRGGHGFDNVVLYLGSGATADFRGNHILRRHGRLVEVGGYNGEEARIDLRENYWGDDRAVQVEWLIHDGADEGREDQPVVQWQPFASEPVATRRQSFGGLKGQR